MELVERSRRHQPLRSSPGFTLVELLVVIGILGTLVALLLPALTKARGAARKTACINNAKQITLALREYESDHGQLPMGAGAWKKTMGVSWLVPLVAYLEAPKQLEELDIQSRDAGSLVLNTGHAKIVDDVTIDALRCPSTTFPATRKVGFADAMMPSYVGLSGAMSGSGFTESRTSRCCRQVPDGETSSGGVLIPNEAIALSHITDGLSNTLCIGETSRHIKNAKGQPQRIDGGFPAGWIAGTRASGTPPNFKKANGMSSWNITTIRYLPNTSDYELPGIDNNRGANNPLVSPHAGGVVVGLCDGSVRFLADDIDLTTLKRLATRDDGQLIASND